MIIFRKTTKIIEKSTICRIVSVIVSERLSGAGNILVQPVFKKATSSDSGYNNFSVALHLCVLKFHDYRLTSSDSPACMNGLIVGS